MLKTAPHSTLAPQMWCIKKKQKVGLHAPRFIGQNLLSKLVEFKIFDLICFPRLMYCDQEPLLLLNVTGNQFYGCTYKDILTRCKICFTPKSLSFSLKNHMNVPLS